MNLGALLLVLSNFLDHTDGELARISGKTSRVGHLYDLASDAAGDDPPVHGDGRRRGPRAVARLVARRRRLLLGTAAGVAIALIFFLRMRDRGARRQGREPAGLRRRIRNRGRAVSVAAGDAVQWH